MTQNMKEFRKFLLRHRVLTKYCRNTHLFLVKDNINIIDPINGQEISKIYKRSMNDTMLGMVRERFNTSHYIQAAFVWDGTTEGMPFWSELNELWIKQQFQKD